MSEPGVTEVIRRRWCEVLDIGSAGEHDDFFLSGGNSLLAVRLTGAIRDEVGIRIPISALFETRELGKYVARVAGLCRTEPVNELTQ